MKVRERVESYEIMLLFLHTYMLNYVLSLSLDFNGTSKYLCVYGHVDMLDVLERAEGMRSHEEDEDSLIGNNK